MNGRVAHPQAAFAELLAAIRSGDRRRCRRACEDAARRVRDEPGLAGSLTRLLGSLPRGEQWPVAFVLFRAGHPSAAALRVAVGALGSGDSDVRWAACRALAEVPPPHRAEVGELLAQAARTGSPLQRRMALYALRDLPGMSAPAIRAARSALRAPHWLVRLAAAGVVARREAPAAAARCLAGLLEDPDLRVARGAAALLAGIAPRPPDTEDALRQAAARGDPSLTRAAERALAVPAASRPGESGGR